MDRRVIAAILAISILGIAASVGPLSLADTDRLEPNPDLAELYAAETDEITIEDVEVTDPSLLTRLTGGQLQQLATISTGSSTYNPGDTVTIDFTDSAHTSCDNAEFRVEFREPGSSSTTASASDSLSKYDGSVLNDQLVTGSVSYSLSSSAKDGTWDAVGYLYCNDDGSIGDHDGTTFTVDAPDDSGSDDTDDSDTDDSGTDPADPVEAELTRVTVNGESADAGLVIPINPGGSIDVGYELRNIGDESGEIEFRVVGSATGAETVIERTTHTVSGGNTVTNTVSVTFPQAGEFDLQTDALADGGNDAWWDEPIIHVASNVYYIDEQRCVSTHPVNIPAGAQTYDTQTLCEQQFDIDSGDDEMHWLDRFVVNLWNRLTGWI